jgi:hypothetical protein
MFCLRDKAFGSIILALVLSTPVCAFSLRTNKFVDTFEQRYPAEQVQTPSSDERDDTPQKQHTQTPKTDEVEERKKPVNVTTTTRTFSPKRSTSPARAVANSFGYASPKVFAKKRKSANYVFQRRYYEWVVVRWANGDCKIWHNDSSPPSGHGWNVIGFANTADKAYLKLTRLYRMAECV